MLDIGGLLAPLQIPVEENCFLKAPGYPFLVWFCEEETGGGDEGQGVVKRRVTLELYSRTVNRALETGIANILQGISAPYQKNRVWIEEESCFMTLYSFERMEKMEV